MVRHYIEYIMFLYRLSKICMESVNVMSGHYINHVVLIVLQNKGCIYSEIEPLLAMCDSDSNR
jgi:hypothetical protein